MRKRGAPEFSAIISSIGAGLILMNVAQRLSETRVLRYPFGTLPVEMFMLFGLRVTLIQAIIVGSALRHRQRVARLSVLYASLGGKSARSR